jgi:hypothetical protein
MAIVSDNGNLIWNNSLFECQLSNGEFEVMLSGETARTVSDLRTCFVKLRVFALQTIS